MVYSKQMQHAQWTRQGPKEPYQTIYQSLFSGKTFFFVTPAADFLSSEERKNKLGPSEPLSK
jgi:hypothetical protein